MGSYGGGQNTSRGPSPGEQFEGERQRNGGQATNHRGKGDRSREDSAVRKARDLPSQHDPAGERPSVPLDVGLKGAYRTRPSRTTSPPAGGNIHQLEFARWAIRLPCGPWASLLMARSPRQSHGGPMAGPKTARTGKRIDVQDGPARSFRPLHTGVWSGLGAGGS